MVEIKPIGDQEDILREARAAAPPPRDSHSMSPSTDISIPVSVTRASPLQEPTTASNVTSPTYRAAEGRTQPFMRQENNAPVSIGYTYRLPRGAYMLIVLYLQVLATFALLYISSGASVAAISLSSASGSYPGFIIPLVAAVIAAFILSGKNILRIIAVLLSLGTGIYTAIMIGRTIGGLMAFGAMGAGGSAFAAIVIISLPTIVLLFTAGYLMRPNVARAYN